MKKLLFTGSMFMLILAYSCKTEIYKDPSKTIEERVDDLVSKMTLDEKIKVISGDTTGFDTPQIERLGIPAIRLADGPLGVRWGNSTAFPSGVATGATWDTTLIYEIAKAEALEIKAKGRDYLLGPCVGIHRMPLNGRNFESYSEDPYLTTRLAVNWIKGLQSEKVISSVKHYAVNDQEWERNNYDVIVDERTLREIHLPAFEAAVKEADAMSVMSAYNIVNGQHCSENYHLLSDILKKEWGFKGFVVSDWTSVYSTEHAVNAGLDLEMPRGIYFNSDSLKKYLANGKITEATIDDKVKRIMRAAFWAGLFDTKKQIDSTIYDKHKDLALKSAQKGITLLKNDGILPLDITKIKTIAVIGPNAKETAVAGGGSAQVTPFYEVSPLEGIQKRFGSSVNVLYATGDSFPKPDLIPVQPEFLFTPDKKENGLQGEYFNNMKLEGTPVLTRTDKNLSFEFGSGGPAQGIGANKFSVRWTGWIKVKETGEYSLSTLSDDGIRVYFDDKLVLENWSNHGNTLDETKIMLKADHDYKFKLEFYDDGGEATIKLGLGRKQKVASNPIQLAAETAAKADVAIIFAGSKNLIESEGRDRDGLELPGKQEELIRAVLKANKNVIVLLNGGTPMKVGSWIKDVKALVNMYFAGQETGTAIAGILSGDVNPSGKLPFSFISDYNQSPAFKGYKDKSLKVYYSEGIFVGYRFLDKENMKPEFPFGFGLSYTTFEYSNIKIKLLAPKTFEVSLEVKNTGSKDGDEVVQLYVSDLEASVARPAKELKGFSRVSLKAGESKTINMLLKERDFAFWDVNSNNWKVENGDFEIQVGASSADIRLREKIKIE